MLYNRQLGHGENRSLGYMSIPSAADLNGDGKAEIIAGNIRGGLNSFGSVPQQVRHAGISQPLLAEKVAFTLYPNPAGHALHIRLDAYTGNGSVSIKIISMAGQEALNLSQNAASADMQIDISVLPQGIYATQVTYDGKVGYKMLVVE
jgi:hypothetical protein